MKDDDEGDDDGCGEGDEWLILSYLRGFKNELTDGHMDICDCRVDFATEKLI